jgi:sortase (surface protein transpeptidase)
LSPLTSAAKINDMEKELKHTANQLTAKKQAAMAELSALLTQEEDQRNANQDSDHQEHQVADQEKLVLRKQYLQTEIEKFDADLVSLYSTVTEKYLDMDAAIGATHSADAEKLKKAASSFTRIKVCNFINHRFSIKVRTRSLL